MELLDVVDPEGNPTGKTVARDRAHAEGIRHRTSHVWLLRRGENGETQVLLQKRSSCKDSFPDCWDISSAGHIPAGCGFMESALRELKEELGITLLPQDLRALGILRKSDIAVFHGKPYHDEQVSMVYCAVCPLEEAAFTLQKEEVSAVRWIGLLECKQAVAEGSIPNCIYPDELSMLPAVLP